MRRVGWGLVGTLGALAWLGCVEPPAKPAEQGETVTPAPQPPDAGPEVEVPDAGPEPYRTVVPEDVEASQVQEAGADGWRFYGTEHGLPGRVYGASLDEGGNVWVAGGGDGLYVLRRGKARFEHFSTPAPALSVAGGPPGVAFVGYEGASGCDMAWDLSRDKVTAKTGDADRVWLVAGGGLARAHYDISSGPGMVAAEPEGREKLCTVYRILYDGKHKSVWFAANHGVAWGDPESTWVQEHTHPNFNCYQERVDEAGNKTYHYTFCSGDYLGLAIAENGDVWLGGRERASLFPFATQNRNFWSADDWVQERVGNVRPHHLDLWPDQVPQDPYPWQAVEDDTYGFAPLPDGYVWAGSLEHGLTLLDASQKHVGFFTKALASPGVTALRTDPRDQSVWAGHPKGGLTRVQGSTWTHYKGKALGKFATSRVRDIQVLVEEGGQRTLVVGFERGGVGVYTGQ